MKVICIGGLPGSGKTMLGRKLAIEEGCQFFDDMDEWQIKPLLSYVADKKNKSVVISDTRFCLRDVRHEAAVVLKRARPDVIIEWILFDNEPELCRKNVARRNDGRDVLTHIRVLTSDYNSSGVSDIRPVWNQ